MRALLQVDRLATSQFFVSKSLAEVFQNVYFVWCLGCLGESIPWRHRNCKRNFLALELLEVEYGDTSSVFASIFSYVVCRLNSDLKTGRVVKAFSAHRT